MRHPWLHSLMTVSIRVSPTFLLKLMNCRWRTEASASALSHRSMACRATTIAMITMVMTVMVMIMMMVVAVVVIVRIIRVTIMIIKNILFLLRYPALLSLKPVEMQHLDLLDKLMSKWTCRRTTCLKISLQRSFETAWSVGEVYTRRQALPEPHSTIVWVHACSNRGDSVWSLSAGPGDRHQQPSISGTKGSRRAVGHEQFHYIHRSLDIDSFIQQSDDFLKGPLTARLRANGAVKLVSHGHISRPQW